VLAHVFKYARKHEPSCKKNWLQSETSPIEAAKNTYSTFNEIINSQRHPRNAVGILVKRGEKYLVTLYFDSPL